MKIIQVEGYGGMDWHDSTESTSYLKENGSYNIVNTDKVIADDVVKRFSEIYKWHDDDKNIHYSNSLDGCTSVPDIRPSLEEVRTAVENNQPIKAEFNRESFKEADGKTVYFYDSAIYWDPENEEIKEEYLGGQITQHTWYVIKEIPDENVRYLVTENFQCPNKGVPSVSRFYSLPVKSCEEAEKQMGELKLHERGKGVWADSVKELVIFDVDEQPNTMWYALNIQAIKEEEELRDILKRYRMPEEIPFRMYAKQHIEELEKAQKEAHDRHREQFKAKAGLVKKQA